MPAKQMQEARLTEAYSERVTGKPPVHDALIVGFGPTGATLANLLARSGLDVAVVDAARDIYDKPRAITLDHEVMRVFQAGGRAHEIAPFTAPHPGTHYLGVDGRVIKKFDPLPPPYPLGWPPTVTFVQPEVEALLRAGVTGARNVDILLGEPAVAFAQDREGVALTLRDGQRLRARYLLACDGANSFVRKELDVPLEDLAFDEWWLVVDARIVRETVLPEKCIQYCWPSRPATFVLGPGNLRRWEIKMLPGETPEEFGRSDNVERLLSRFVDPDSVEIWRSAVYRFHALLAARWRYRRVFLLGDACHQTPPFLGQGMCAGIRDAANLAWKLAFVLRDGAPESLLDSYELERAPHVRRLVATAKEFGQIIGELDPVAARARDDRLRGQLERGEAETIRQRYIPDLTSGIIDHRPAAKAAGALFVQPQVRQPGGAALLDDVLPPRFLIVTATADIQARMSSSARAKWRRLQGERVVLRRADQPASPSGDGVRELIETNGLFADWASRQGCAAAVVRPDRYVFGLARDAIELDRLVTDVDRQVFGSDVSEEDRS
ncbi:MAG TPA: bifunctional 3-(3-hydroxy-phenyl)propionate/3-hydroxycinnamic acid hydroxylase [Xanthobacteraceae bacterium]